MHAGSRIRPEIAKALTVKRVDRFREEDPFMGAFIRDFPIQIIARDSRFEYDLNREPHRAFYPFGSLKWGLKVWCRELTEEEQELSIMKHHEFHELVDMVAGYLLSHNRHALVFDMHSYCFQREGTNDWYEDPRPEINLGTRPVNREHFSQAIDSFLKDLSNTGIGDRPIRVAENEVFPGGYLSRRLSKKWFDNILVLALEYKKIFMDEWTGQVYREILDELVQGFRTATDRLVNSEFI